MPLLLSRIEDMKLLRETAEFNVKWHFMETVNKAGKQNVFKLKRLCVEVKLSPLFSRFVYPSK